MAGTGFDASPIWRKESKTGCYSAWLFWLGEMRWSAELSGRIAPKWGPGLPGYGIHLSCRAFDLEETHRFDEAERLAREAVDIDPGDVWGAHAVAHVMFMQARHREGIEWLDELKNNWAEANQMQLHLWWHRCLFHIERGELDAALHIHDAWVRNRDLLLLESMPDLYIDMQNGASLLLRLELRGIDVGDRWDELAELTLKRLDDHTSPFTSAHYGNNTLAMRYQVAAIPAAEGAIAHRTGYDQRVVDILMPTRQMLWQMGGSHAQRDLFFLIFADSALKLGRNDLVNIVLDDVAAAGFTEPAARIGYRKASGTA